MWNFFASYPTESSSTHDLDDRGGAVNGLMCFGRRKGSRSVIVGFISNTAQRLKSSSQVASVHAVKLDDDAAVHFRSSSGILTSIGSSSKKTGVVGPTRGRPALGLRWSTLHQLHCEAVEAEGIEHGAMPALGGPLWLPRVGYPCTLP